VDRATTVLHRRIGRSLQRVDELEYVLRERMRAVLQRKRAKLQADATRLRGLDLRLRFANARRRLEAAQRALAQLARLRVTKAGGRLDPLIAHLTQLSPLKILDRGYAIVQNEQGHVVKQPSEAPPDSMLEIRLAQGRIRARTLRD
jgi:exodeoxyribonuclease VII large subunit